MAIKIEQPGIAAPVEATARKKRYPRRKRYQKWLLIGLLGGLTLTLVGVLFLAINWPFTKQALIDVLQERSTRSVTIGAFHTTYFPPGCVAEQIRFLPRKHKDKPPLITIEKILIQGSYWGMILPDKHLSNVRVYGMHITVPPPKPNGGPNPIMPLTHSSNPAKSIAIGNIVADGAVLEFVQRTPGKPSFQMAIHKLDLKGVGNDQPLNYRARIYNTTPPGIIDSAGSFGTWNPDNPGTTPVHGWYSFTKANLGVYKLINGILSSNGSFSGTLANMDVKGSVDVPNFYVVDSAHTRDLRSEFDATVVATDGNVALNKVTAHFDRTTVMFTGTVDGQKNSGKAVSLTLQCDRGRIEDLLGLIIADKQAPMSGGIAVRGRFVLPPDPKSFLSDMRIDGKFGVESGKFSSTDIQTTLARVSDSAAKKDGLPTENAATLVSELDGGVSVRNGIAYLSNIKLQFPGGVASLRGSYSLLNYDIDLHGTLATDGSPSAASTGFKALLLKTASPLFKKDGKGRKTIPFKISGNYYRVQVGLDLGNHKK